MEFHKEKLELRLYQQTILATAAAKNTLVILPTGLGKTFIAIALASLRLKDNSKILILAPTKPLVNQHLRTFSEFFDFDKDELLVFSGEVNSKQRPDLWAKAKIIFSTPQTIKNDVISGRVKLNNVSLVVFDEAHRAVGDYSYVFLAKTYLKQAFDARILALTASPGTSEDKINEICGNLFIDSLEARNRDQEDVKPYVKPIIIDHKFVEFPAELKLIQEHLTLAIKNRLTELKRLGFMQTIDSSKLSKKGVLALQFNLQAQIRQRKFEVSRGLSVCAALMKLLHARGLIESESVGALQKYLKALWDTSRRTKVRAVKDLVSDFHVRLVYSHLQEILAKGVEHPKLAALKKLVKQQIEEKPNSKILVFTEFRSNISQMIAELESIKKIEVHKFIGQSSKLEKGMSQKTQAEVIKRFEDGDLNCLVCTSVAEEGLDIPAVDLVVFYSPIPSAIRTIQRRGRTGRQAVGKMTVLITKSTRDEAFYWVARNREAKMETAVNQIKNKRQGNLENYFIKAEKTQAELVRLGPTEQGSKWVRSVRAKPEEKLMIFADVRERGPIIEQLFEKGINVKLGSLKAGDFILSEDVGVERKEVSDFVISLLDRRLFEQAKNLKASFTKPLMIIEGDLDEMFKVRRVHPNALWAALASLVLDLKIPILFSTSSFETANLLSVIAKREQLDLKKQVSLRGGVRPKEFLDLQQYFIEGLPQVGPSLAKSLLKEFKSPKNIVNATEDDLKKVEKLGPKKAKQIRQLLDKEYY